MSLSSINSKRSMGKPADPAPEPPGGWKEREIEPVHGGNGHGAPPNSPLFTRQPPTIRDAEDKDRRSYLPDVHRLLPQAPDAERMVLACVLNSPDHSWRRCRQRGITTALFHIPAHATIFEVAEDMYREGGKPFHFISVTNELRERQQLDQVGGASNVTEIFTLTLDSGGLDYYLDILEEMATRRVAIMDFTNLAARLYEPVDKLGDLLAEASDRLKKVSAGVGYKSRLPPFEDVSLHLGGELPAEPDQLITGLLHRGSKIIVGGTSKGRKTWSLMDMAVSLACGVDFWGFPCRAGKVAYINFEIQRAFAYKRAEAICRAKGVELPAGMLMMINLRGMVAGIEKMSDDLIAMMRDGDIAAVIVDPIYKALGNRDENKAGDVASLCNELERIAVETGAAIAWGAHYSKGSQANKESIDRIGGSGVWARDPDSILTMTAHEDEDSFTVEMTLRNFKPCPSFVVHWNWPLFTRDEQADPEALKQPRKPGERTFGSASSNAEEMLQFIGRAGLEYAVWQKAAAKELGTRPGTFEKYFTMLRKGGRIIKVGAGWMIRGYDEKGRREE
jgi:hypothetical protein